MMGVTNAERILNHLLAGSPWEWASLLAIVVGIGVIGWWLVRYRASLHGDSDPAAADAHLVTHLRELHRGGAVSDEEYRSLKSRLRPPGGALASGAAADVPAPPDAPADDESAAS